MEDDVTKPSRAFPAPRPVPETVASILRRLHEEVDGPWCRTAARATATAALPEVAALVAFVEQPGERPEDCTRCGASRTLGALRAKLEGR